MTHWRVIQKNLRNVQMTHWSVIHLKNELTLFLDIFSIYVSVIIVKYTWTL